MSSFVYTSIVGSRDLLLSQPDSGDQYLAFLEPSRTRAAPWIVVDITERKFADARMEAKRYKILPHLTLPEHEYSLWIDGNVEMISSLPLKQLAAVYLRDADIALFVHPKRSCIYEETWTCINQNLDDHVRIYTQILRYTREGFPANMGLHEATVILRRNTPAIREFNEAWWDEIRRGSVRDQISLDYVIHKHGVKVAEFPGSIGANPLLVKHRHGHPPILNVASEALTGARPLADLGRLNLYARVKERFALAKDKPRVPIKIGRLGLLLRILCTVDWLCALNRIARVVVRAAIGGRGEWDRLRRRIRRLGRRFRLRFGVIWSGIISPSAPYAVQDQLKWYRSVLKITDMISHR